MKFVCDRCQTRYSIADEKVRQKILRIRCKTCGNVIVVQGGREPVAASSAAGEITDGAEHFESAKTDATGAPNPVPTSASPKAAPTSAPGGVGGSTKTPNEYKGWRYPFGFPK